MGPVNPLRFAEFVQAKAVEYHICILGQIHRFFFQNLIPLTGSFIASGRACHNKIVFSYELCHLIQLCHVDHGRACPLVSGLKGEISHQGHMGPRFQGKDIFPVFQKYRTLGSRLPSQSMMAFLIKSICPGLFLIIPPCQS